MPSCKESIQGLLQACTFEQPKNLFVPWDGKWIKEGDLCGFEFPEAALRVTSVIVDSMAMGGEISLQLSRKWTVVRDGKVVAKDVSAPEAASVIFDRLNPIVKDYQTAHQWEPELKERLLGEE